MKTISRLFFAVSVLAVSSFVQAEGVSQEDINGGNHPAATSLDSGSRH